MTRQMIHRVLLIFSFFLLYTGVGFCDQRSQSILKSVRTGEHENFTRIVFEFQNTVQFKNPKIKDRGKFSVLFLDSSTGLASSTVYETDSLQKVQSVEFIKNESNLTANITLMPPYFMIKTFTLADPVRVVVDAYPLTPSTKDVATDTSSSYGVPSRVVKNPETEKMVTVSDKNPDISLNHDVSSQVVQQSETKKAVTVSGNLSAETTAKPSAKPLSLQQFTQKNLEPSEEKDRTMSHIIPDDPKEETRNEIIDKVTEQTQQDIHRVDRKIDVQSEELMRRQRLTDRKVEALNQKLSDLNAKTSASEWAQRIRFGGDIRLRYQGDYYDEDNALLLDPNDPDELMNTTSDRYRMRYRARLGMKIKLVDPRPDNVGKVEVGIRLSTGNQTNAVSTNDTLGDYNNKDDIVFDRAYLRYTYTPDEPLWGNNIPQFMASGGRIPNPWFYTDLLWDHDLNFEGAAINFLTDTQDITQWKGFLTAGVFPLQEDAFSSSCDKWLYGGQVGFEYKPRFDITTKLGFAYYDYDNIVGEANDPSYPGEKDCTAPLYLQKGNTLFDIDPDTDILPALASDYKLVNITGAFDFGMFHPVHIILLGDYVKNIGFDRGDVARRTGETDISEENEGYQIGMTVGYPKISEFGEWNIFYTYRYLEADAVVDAFTDSDFHDGGTNAEGWILGGSLGLYRDLWLRARWLTSNEISGPSLSIDTLQVDLNARF
jgi:hypothetical protein